MEAFRERIDLFKKELKFPEQLMGIPDEYIVLALTTRSGYRLLPRQVQDQIGSVNYEFLEFLGDAVLELAVTDWLYFSRQKMSTLLVAHELRVRTVQNLNLHRIMKPVCNLAITGQQPIDSKKICADILEATIGAVYIYLRMTNNCNTIELIQYWLFENMGLLPVSLEKKLTLKDIPTPGQLNPDYQPAAKKSQKVRPTQLSQPAPAIEYVRPKSRFDPQPTVLQLTETK
jgi:hypothetical protein